MRPRLDGTIEERKFIKLRARGASIPDAAKGAGICKASGYSLMKRDSVKLKLAEEMEKQGINMESISKGMAEGFESMAPPRKDGGMQYADMFTRKQYIDMAIRVLGLYAPDELNINKKVIHINITPEMTKSLLDAQVIEAEELGEIINAEAEIIEDDSGSYIEVGGSVGLGDGGRAEEDSGGTGEDQVRDDSKREKL